MKKFTFILIIGLLIQSNLKAQSKKDSLAIIETASNYIEGWYTGDSVRMGKSLYPELAKRGILPSKDGKKLEVANASYNQMVHWAGGRPNMMKENKVKQGDLKLKIIEIGKNIANVRCESPDFIDYLHLGRINDEWKIVNAIWEFNKK